jgi:hypothetical protein
LGIRRRVSAHGKTIERALILPGHRDEIVTWQDQLQPVSDLERSRLENMGFTKKTCVSSLVQHMRRERWSPSNGFVNVTF